MPNKTISEETGDFYPVLTMPLPRPLSQRKHFKTLHGTQTVRDDLLFTSVIDLLFSSLLWLGAGGYFSLDSIYGRTGIVQEVSCFTLF